MSFDYCSIVKLSIKKKQEHRLPRTLCIWPSLFSCPSPLSHSLIHPSRPSGFKCGIVHSYKRHLNTPRFPHFLIAYSTFKFFRYMYSSTYIRIINRVK